MALHRSNEGQCLVTPTTSLFTQLCVCALLSIPGHNDTSKTTYHIQGDPPMRINHIPFSPHLIPSSLRANRAGAVGGAFQTHVF